MGGYRAKIEGNLVILNDYERIKVGYREYETKSWYIVQ